MNPLSPMSPQRRARGFSLVELMVSVVIGLLALMFATRLVITGEANKDAAVGGSDAMQNGMLALFSLSGDAAQAGWGLNDKLLTGCNTVFSDSQGYQLLSVQRNGAAVQPLAGVVIQSNGANPDLVSFNSGTSQAGVGSVRLIADYAGGNALSVDQNSPYGFSNGDVIVVAPNAVDDVPCTLAQMSGFNPAKQNDMLINAGPNYRFNPISGLAQNYVEKAAYAYNLGQPNLLHFHTWSVNNGVLLLRATDLPGAAANPVAVVDNVVSIKAQYGFDTRALVYYDPSPPSNSQLVAVYQNGVPTLRPPSGMQITQWSPVMINADASANSPATGDALDYQRIVAVRLAVVARSKTAEKPGANGQCSATLVQPIVFGSIAPAGVAPVPVTVNVAVAGDKVDWKCYRYRVFETIVPIVNSQFRP